MTDDAAQLRRYAHEGAEEAFAQVVARHLPLVHSAALRQVGGDEHLAKDVAQTVFMALARQAAILCRREIITGWLYTTTRYVAAKLVRSERRRQTHEQASATMREVLSQPDAESDWNQVGPVLDEAMAALSRADRELVLLRFFEANDLKTLGVALGISEDAARMRVNRALEKLRTLLRRRGIVCSASALGTALGSEAVGTVPAALTASVTGTALAGAAGDGGAAAAIPPILKVLIMTKLKAGIIGAAVTVGVVVPWVIQRQVIIRLESEMQALRHKGQQVDALRADNARLSNQLTQAEGARALSADQLAELTKLRAEAGNLRRQATELSHRLASDRNREVAGRQTDAKGSEQ